MHSVAPALGDFCRGSHCSGGGTGDPRPCTGAHCPGSRSSRLPRQFNPAPQWRTGHAAATPHHVHPSPQRAPLETEPHGGGGGCSDTGCTRIRLQQPRNESRDCRGIECRLPLRIRPKVRGGSCVGEECSAAAEADMSSVYLSDRAAQFLGDYPEFGHAASELGGAPLGVQLTCDIKPGLFPSQPRLFRFKKLKMFPFYHLKNSFYTGTVDTVN